MRHLHTIVFVFTYFTFRAQVLLIRTLPPRLFQHYDYYSILPAGINKLLPLVIFVVLLGLIVALLCYMLVWRRRALCLRQWRQGQLLLLDMDRPATSYSQGTDCREGFLTVLLLCLWWNAQLVRSLYRVYIIMFSKLTLTVLVATIDAQWEGMGDVGSARYEPALLPPCSTIRVLSYSNY